MKTKLLLIPFMIALMLIVACGGNSTAQDEDAQLILDWFPNSNHAGIFQAISDDQFTDQGINLEVVTPTDPTAIITAVATGQVDFGISYAADVLQARAAGIDIVSVLAIAQHPLVSIMTLGDSGITHPDQLAGKTIGYPGIPSQLSMLETILDRYDIDMDDITLSNVGFDLVRVLVGGSVDAILGAYYTHESILIHQQTDLEPNIIQVEEHGVPDYYELVLITAADNLETRPEFVEKVATGVINGYEAAANAPQDSITNLLAQAGSEVVDEQLEREGVELLLPLWQDPATGVPFGHQAEQKWAVLADWLNSNGLIDDPDVADGAYTNEFVN